ncbi:MAG: GNAT family N-acetyltransferase [Desulfobacteraceae bacterium]|nr:GNAT family N-acetyltransferase [Desulfobacteraceae bacterium]
MTSIMISQIKTIEEIKPIFKTYLGYMGQIYNIAHLDAWRDNAMKNLQDASKTDHKLIYSLKQSGTIIGFAQMNKHLRFNNEGLAIAEFYIQKDHQRKGHGRRLAEHVFELFPGHWEISVAINNNLALEFWKQVVSSYTFDKFIEKRKASINTCGLLFKNK